MATYAAVTGRLRRFAILCTQPAVRRLSTQEERRLILVQLLGALRVAMTGVVEAMGACKDDQQRWLARAARRERLAARAAEGQRAMLQANTCVGFHVSSRQFRDQYVSSEGAGPKMPQALAMAIVGASVGKAVAVFPGGVLCRDAASGSVVGAISVSGASSDEDEHCAIVGAQAVRRERGRACLR